MMSSFQALMALSASQTKQSQSAVQSTLQERQRKEAARRKEQEEKDRKDKERERELRMKLFEKQKKEEERLKREEDKRKAMEAMLLRREDEQRNALLYGPKRGNKWPTSTSGVKDAVRRSRLPNGEDDEDGEPAAGSFLTREERRQRKQEAEQKRLYAPSRRSLGAGGYSKQGKRLPGGAVDITVPTSTVEPSHFKSVKDRLAALPITLTKLNVVKRDTRTIDEIVQDRAKAKVLDGDKAREFSDWFGSSKKKETVKKASPPITGSWSSSSSSVFAMSGSQGATSAVTSGTNTPVSQRGTPPSGASSSAAAKKAPAQSAKMSSMPTPSKSKATASPSLGTTKSYPGLSQLNKTSGVNGKSAKLHSTIPPSSSQPSIKAHTHHTLPKKRPRSESRSASPQPKRRAHISDEDDISENIGSMIWSMFGRNREEYISRDIFSDDEDMEADASIMAREEALSSRIAAREDQIALEEERRREEEKRRRKKERDARAASSR